MEKCIEDDYYLPTFIGEAPYLIIRWRKRVDVLQLEINRFTGSSNTIITNAGYAASFIFVGSAGYAAGFGFAGGACYAAGFGFAGGACYAAGFGFTGNAGYAAGFGFAGSARYTVNFGYSGIAGYTAGFGFDGSAVYVASAGRVTGCYGRVADRIRTGVVTAALAFRKEPTWCANFSALRTVWANARSRLVCDS